MVAGQEDRTHHLPRVGTPEVDEMSTRPVDAGDHPAAPVEDGVPLHPAEPVEVGVSQDWQNTTSKLLFLSQTFRFSELAKSGISLGE